MKKKNLLVAYIFFFGLVISAQDAVHNFGNLKIHQDGAVGFHYDLINDGFTDDNQGLAGFFNNQSIIISGAFRPIFQDMEIMVNQDLFLDVGVGVTNNVNFVLGDVVTPRNQMDVNLDYIANAFYNSEDDFRKIDGYSALTNKQTFTFPVGYDDRLRELTINSSLNISNAKCAYYFENPNNPINFNNNFDTSLRTDILTAVSTYEFWDLDGAEESLVELKWDMFSNLSNFVDEIENLRVVGWHTQNGIWENLGGININGNMTSGQISSESFVPDNYSVITFGSSLSTNNISLGNYLLTPNNDGSNDFLHFDAISLSPNNELRIFNRWGRAVYTKTDYKNTFDGRANVSSVVNKSKILPNGVYFYIIDLKDIQRKHQGFLYISE